jgi:hypothetical protein
MTKRKANPLGHRERGGWKRIPLSMSERGSLGHLASRGKRAPMDHILIQGKPQAPASSWWIDVPREAWQASCDREAERMRSSMIANTNVVRRLEDVA